MNSNNEVIGKEVYGNSTTEEVIGKEFYRNYTYEVTRREVYGNSDEVIGKGISASANNEEEAWK